jgi:dipeptidyl aminopeptidase/acylaminoacyl peptidase
LHVFIMHRRTFLVACAVFASAAFLPGASEATVPRAITAEDLWAVKRPSALELSPDQRRLVFAVQEFDLEKNKSTKSLWLLDAAGGAERRLTAADSTDNTPAWSPDSTRIAFTAKRPGDEQPALYVIRTDGGEAEKILELPLPIAKPRWLPDGRVSYS